jgi:DNA polymerase III subunit gamma/tau
MAWYNKYRPSNFAQASGQELVKKVLQNSVRTIFSANPKVKHAYLFSGPRGTGKTSLARIFAKSINCTDENSVTNLGEACGVCDNCKNGQIDIIELDAASNTGIDNIRDLIEAANTAPFISRYKVYIIDEVHMLSKAAMNALLKTLEEPPAYIVFLMATTDPEKILPTILSRVTHLKLTNHSLSDISKLLTEICHKENVEIDAAGIDLIAKMAAGGLRDAINLLETVSNYGLEKYNESEIAEILGVLPTTRLLELANSLLAPDLNHLKANIQVFEDLGTDPQILLTQLLDYLLSSSLEKFILEGEANNHYQALIQILADILSNNLAVSSVKSALLLVKIRLIDNNTGNLPISPILNPEIKVAKKVVEISNPPVSTPSVIIQEVEPTKTIPAHKNEVASVNDGKINTCDFIELISTKLKIDKTAPMKVKMFYESLQAFQDSDTVYLYTPNKIAIMPLKSPDVNKWLNDLAKAELGENFILKIVFEEDSEDFTKIKDLIQSRSGTLAVPSTAVPSPLDKNIVAQPETQTLPVKPNPEPHTLGAKDGNEDFKLSDFYYLYGPLKDGTYPKGMKLLSQKEEIPKQAKQQEDRPNQDNTTNHWENELDDLELE